MVSAIVIISDLMVNLEIIINISMYHNILINVQTALNSTETMCISVIVKDLRFCSGSV